MDSPIFRERDEAVRCRVETYLTLRHSMIGNRLEVHVDEGVVEIKGYVNSFYEKQVAIHSCRRVAGVRHLVDRIEVNATDGHEAMGISNTTVAASA